MAKAAKTAASAEPTETSEAEASAAALIPAPLVAAVEEQDPVLQAHFVRQANHFTDMAPSLAKQDRADRERQAELTEHQIIAARWEAHIAEQRRIQQEREDRENAAARITGLEGEIAELEASLSNKTAELDRLKKLAKEG